MTRSRKPATTELGEENRLVALAMDLASRQLRDGTASSQVITHFLKLGSQRGRLEAKRIEQENLLIAAKIQQIQSSSKIEDLYAAALEAMSQYSGNNSD